MSSGADNCDASLCLPEIGHTGHGTGRVICGRESSGQPCTYVLCKLYVRHMYVVSVFRHETLITMNIQLSLMIHFAQ